MEAYFKKCQHTYTATIKEKDRYTPRNVCVSSLTCVLMYFEATV